MKNYEDTLKKYIICKMEVSYENHDLGITQKIMVSKYPLITRLRKLWFYSVFGPFALWSGGRSNKNKKPYTEPKIFTGIETHD